MNLRQKQTNFVEPTGTSRVVLAKEIAFGVANPSYDECNKSNLKIYQIYFYNKNIRFNAIFSMPFYCFT